MSADTIIIFYIMSHDDKYIPKNELNAGSGVALDNSRKFAQSMKYLYDGKFYESGTIIGTLALEEFGKYLYLLKHYNNNGLITHNDKIFHDHDAKFDALVEDYKDMPNQNDLIKVKNDLKTLKKLRFQLLYAKWDNAQKKWIEPSLDHNVIKYMNNIIDKVIIKHIESYGSDPELATARYSKLMELMSKNKIYVKCRICKMVMNTNPKIVSGCKCKKIESWTTHWK